MEAFRRRILERLDKMESFEAKLAYLNSEYLKAKTIPKEERILKMIEELKSWGK